MTVSNTPSYVDRIAAAQQCALKLAAQGIPVFPVREDKRPACPNGFKNASTDPDVAKLLWKMYPAPYIGVPTGEASGLAVLDIDPRHNGNIWLEKNMPNLPATRVHYTKSGGLHFLYNHRAGLRNSAGMIAEGIDVRGEGGYIVWWPATGFDVQSDHPIEDWPDWLFSLTQKKKIIPASSYNAPPPIGTIGHAYARAALRRATENVAYALEGCRNDTLYRETWSLLRFAEAGALDVQAVASAMSYAGVSCGLAHNEVVNTIASALRSRGF